MTRSFCRPGLRAALLLFLPFILLGCSLPIQHGLTEREANEIVVVLARHGIEGTKEADKSGREVTWKVIVPKSDASRSFKILREFDLPRRKVAGFAKIFGKSGLIPTATEEKAKLLQAISGELIKTLKAVDGIVDAHVHIVIPADKILRRQGEKKPQPTASVLLKIRQERGKPAPISIRDVRKLVAGSVEALRPSEVTVVTTVATRVLGATQISPTSAGGVSKLVIPRTVSVLSVRVLKADATKLKLILGGLSVLFLLSLVGLAVFFLKVSSLKGQVQVSAVPPEDNANNGL